MSYAKWALSMALAVSDVNAMSTAPDGVAFFNGEITKDSVAAFLAKYDRRMDLTEFSVTSQGGDLLSSMTLGRWIHMRKLNVRVRSLCFSGCANYLFVAGDRKIIESGAFVAWHGDAEQKDFRELVAKYQGTLEKRLRGKRLSRNEARFLVEFRLRFEGITEAQRQQSEFYRLVGVDPMMGRYGQEPVNYPSDAWTFTLSAMNLLGIKNVSGDADYGRARYFMRAGPAASMLNGGPLQAFDSPDGINIIPLP
jgi:hypothetical protein